MAFAFANVCLPGTAFLGDDWVNIHARELQETCSHLLIREEKPQCILLCGVGNAIDPITHEGRHGVEKVLELAFTETSAEEHGPPLCAWLSDNTMVAARPGGQIHPWQLAVADANFKAVPQEQGNAFEHDLQNELSGGRDTEDEISFIGYALARILAFLPEFRMLKQSTLCIDSAASNIKRDECSKAAIESFVYCMECFFSKPPVRHSTASTNHAVPAPALKSTKEIKAAWKKILAQRRMEEKDDTAPINDNTRLQKMHAKWFQDFQNNELTPKQRLHHRSKQHSAFEEYLGNNFGSKAFVMAVWQTGISRAVTTHVKKTNYNVAPDHIAWEIRQWAQRIIKARQLHQEDADAEEQWSRCIIMARQLYQKDADTEEARIRSGDTTSKRGWTHEKPRDQRIKRKAHTDDHWPQTQNWLPLASTGKRKRKREGRATDESLAPTACDEMTRSELWRLLQS